MPVNRPQTQFIFKGGLSLSLSVCLSLFLALTFSFSLLVFLHLVLSFAALVFLTAPNTINALRVETSKQERQFLLI